MNLSDLSIEVVLLFTALVIGFELLLFASILNRHKQFHWLSPGFWAWGAFFLYYVLVPLSSLISGHTLDFQVRMEVSGGPLRSLWVLFVILVAIAIFFSVYIRTKPHLITFNMLQIEPKGSIFLFYWLLFFCGYGLYALLASRFGLLTWGGELTQIKGQFVGSVTGYQDAGYMLLYYPSIFLLLSSNRFLRSLGILLSIGFVVLSIPHSGARFATISMLIALTMWLQTYRKKRWPNYFVIVSLVIVTLIYQVRGHTEWQLTETSGLLYESLVTVGDKGFKSLAEADTQMLASFWVESAWRDNWVGYSYGLPFINYLFLGWVPSRIFPQKYFLVNWLKGQNGSYPQIFDFYLYGSKPSLIGVFYSNGSIFGVVIQIIVVGWLSRKLEGMLRNEAPTAVRGLGIAWLSTMWMVWGSGDTWGVMLLGTIAMPFLVGIPIFRLYERKVYYTRKKSIIQQDSSIKSETKTLHHNSYL